MKKLIFMICLLPILAQAQTYDPLAVERINSLITNNGLQATPNAPETWWNFAGWDNSNPKQLTVLKVNNNGLTGYASFAGLTELIILYCYDNNLTGLDITNCKKLIDLDCSENLLTELDVSTNIGLGEINCRLNNISVLDVSNNPKLKYLHCNNNKYITQLDLSNCPLLIWVFCQGNRLTKLDVTNCLQLEWLSCGNNQLTELFVSNLTQLKRLYCFHNKLNELNLNGCTALETLSISVNRIKNIDLSGMNNLTVFESHIQSVHLELQENDNGDYIGYITLNNPTFVIPWWGISYSNGVLKLTENFSAAFITCETGKHGFSLEISMSFSYSQSNIHNNLFTNSLSAHFQNEKLYICGLKVGEKFSVYTISGVLVYQSIAAQEEESVDLQGAKGIYVVRSGERAVKVIKN